jgi:hypothetical protein
MRRETFLEALRRVERAAPFRRFTVELTNGERLIGYHPEIFLVEDDLIVYEERDGTVTYFDASCVARIVNVVIPPGKH